MKLYNTNKNVFHIKVYSKIQDKQLHAWSEHFPLQNDLQSIADVKVNSATLRIPTHGDFVQIKELFMQLVMQESMDISNNIILTFFFVKLLQDWDITDQDGNLLKCEVESFLKLDAKVISLLLSELSMQLEEIEG